MPPLALGGPLGIGDREDDAVVGDRRVGRPDLAAREAPPVAVGPGARRQCRRIGAGARFGQAEAHRRLARHHRRQHALARFVRDLLEKPARPERPVADDIKHQPVLRAAHPEQRFPADIIGKMPEAAAAQRFRHAHVVVAGLGRDCAAPRRSAPSGHLKTARPRDRAAADPRTGRDASDAAAGSPCARSRATRRARRARLRAVPRQWRTPQHLRNGRKGHCWHGPCGVPALTDRANRDTRPALPTGGAARPIRYDGALFSQPCSDGLPMNAPMAANNLNLMKFGIGQPVPRAGGPDPAARRGPLYRRHEPARPGLVRDGAQPGGARRHQRHRHRRGQDDAGRARRLDRRRPRGDYGPLKTLIPRAQPRRLADEDADAPVAGHRQGALCRRSGGLRRRRDAGRRPRTRPRR